MKFHVIFAAVKGIIAIDAMSQLCKIVGNFSGEQYYHEIAVNYAKQWITLANPNGSNHYRLVGICLCSNVLPEV